MSENSKLRQHLGQAPHGRGRMPLLAPLAAVLLAAAAAAGAVLLLAGDRGRGPQEAAFLRDALGARAASAPLVRTPAPGVRVQLRPGGYAVAGPAGSVGLRAVQNGGAIVRHANGISQPTEYGSAAVVVDRERTEQFLTVTRRQGKRTWRWQLETGLVPRVGSDGDVVFLSRSSRRVAGPVLAPVEILDARGRVVTPEGARWSTGRNRHGWELRLTLDDSRLPLPYVIDPAVTHRATTVSNNGAAGANNISLAYPTGDAQYDLLVATIAVRGGVTVGTPSGWTAGRVSQNGTNVRLFTFYKVAGASEPASQSFTWTGTQQAVGAISAYYGVRASLGAGVIDVMGAASTGNSTTASAASITTLSANALVLASYGINNNGTFGAVTGMTERWDAASASATLTARASGSQHDMTQVAAGATGAKTSALGATRQWAGHQHSFEVDNVNPTITATTAAVGRATLNLTSTVADADSGVASVLYERSPAGAGTWTTVGTSTTTPFSFPFDTTAVADGLYDVRATVTDWAGNTATATTLLRVDNSSPDQNTLTLTPLTGTANQYWDGTSRVLFYNPAVAGTFSLSSVPRDVLPPISFVGASSGANNNSPLTLTVPAGVQAGDLLIAQVGYERTGATSVPTPAGWTRHVDRDNGTIYGQVILYRWATASEPASYTIPHASGAASISGTLLAYRDVASVSPLMANNGTVATGTTLTAPSITPPAGCGRLVAFYGLWNTATLTTPTGMTQRATAINTEVDWNSRVLAADEILGAAAATGTRVSTATVTDPNSTGPGSNVSELVALRPLACVSSVQYPTPGQTGFTGGGNTDTVEPYAASPDYSFGPANTVSPGARTIVVSDEAGNPVLNQTITFTRDVAAPVTTDDTGTITNAWRNVDTTVTLSPGDGSGAGVAQTYFTTDGSAPTTGSPTGTSILLTAEGTHTIRYFSTDRVANAEAAKTGAAQIRIDKTNPTSATLNALPAAIRNGQSLTGGGADALSGVGSITYLYCAGAACTPATTIGSSSTAAGGYPVTWNGQPADGTYRVRARVLDAAGNQLDSAIQTVTIDNTSPSGSVTAPAAGANVRGSSVSVTADSADGSGSGVANATFQRSPAGAGTWTTIGVADTSSPYGVSWDTTAVTDGLYDLRVITTDNAGNATTSATVANVRVDNTSPSGSVTAPAAGANVRGSSVSVTADSADGSGSGVANATFQRSPAGAGTWTTIGVADTSSPYGVSWDTTAVTDGLYDLRVITTDNAGNATTSATVANVRVDNALPTQSLALTGVSPAGSAHLNGTDLYYRDAAAGQLRLRNTVADGGSGPASSTTSALGGTSTGWTHTPGTTSTPAGGPYDSNLFSWAAGTTSSPTVDVQAADAAGNASTTTTLTLRNDSTAPTGGALTVNGVGATGGGTSSDSDGTFAIGVRTDWAETASPTASGLASSTLTRQSATYANGTCGSFGGSTVIVGSPGQSLGVGCYRYTLTGVDNVGNSVSVSTDVRVHGPATELALSGSTADLTSGATRVLTATVRDSSGNTVVTDNSTVVTFAKASGAGTVGGTGTPTVTNGVATKTITGALVGSVTMEATASGLATGTLGAFTVVHGAATQIALTGSTADLTSGAGRVLTATVRDAAGNTVTSDSSTVVTFAKASGAGTVGGTGTATVTNGVATKTITGALVGSVTMEATASGLATGTLGAFTVAHGAATQVALTGSTANLTSGANRVLTATVQDAAGNTVTSDSSTVITFAKASGAGTVSGTGTATVANGVATKTVTGALAGSVTMEATAAGLTTGTLGAFTVLHGAATQIALSGSTADLTSGANRVLTATVQDAAGNTVTSDSSTVVTFAKASGAGTVSGTGTATVSNGVATKTVTGALVGSVAMEATASGLATGTLGAFTVVHGAATQVALTGATADLVSGANRVLTATVQDAAGNTVTADSSTVVTFAKASGAGTVSGTGTATVANGVATKTVTGALAGSVTMEATASGLTAGTLGFTVVHGAATQVALTGATTNLTSGANRVLTATIQDAAGNTVTSDNTTVVTFAKASGAGTVSGTGTATVSSGVATKTVTGALVGSVTMEATASGLTTGTLGAFTVVHGVATQVALTGSTANLTSGANRVLTATVQDAAGNTVTSDSTTVVTFAKAAGAGTVSGTGAATVANGVATKTVTGALVGSVTMEATASGLTTGTLGAFTVVHGAATQIALTGSTADLTSGANRVLTATVQDAAGNTVTSDNATVVTFAKAAGAGTVTGLAGGETVTAGVASKTVTGALAGSLDLEATAAGLTAGMLGFTVVHGAATQVALTGSTTNLTSGANRVLTATVQDAAGNTVTSDSSTVVTFAKAAGGGTVTGTGTATATGGVATKTITGALVGSVTMEATATGLTTGTLGAFTVVHGAATQVALTGSTADLTSGASRVLTATVQDAAGNTVTSDSSTVVAFAKASGAGTVSGTGTATVANGVATKTVTGALVGSVTMEATASGLTTGTLGAFTVVHGAATQIALTGSTADLTSGANRVLTATVQDAAGNTVTSDTTTVVTFAKASGAGTVTGTGTATATGGIATKTVTGALVGSVTMDATANGLATGTLGAFTVVHGAATQIDLTGSTADLVSGATRVLTATLRDAAGNVATTDSSTVVAFAKASGAGTVAGAGAATAANGVATKTVTGALAGSVTMEATASGLTTGTLGAFTVVHGAATQVALTGSTADLPSGAARVLTATVQDAAGNTVASDSSTSVAFAQASGTGTVTGLAGAETVSNGVATKTVTGDLAGSVGLEATAGGLADGTLSFDVVHGAAVRVTVSGAVTDLPSGSTRVLTATVRDAAGNRVASDNSTVVTFAKDAGAGTVTGLGADTASAGVASKTVTGELAGAITILASATGLTSDNVSFDVVHGPAAAISLTAPTSSFPSGTNRLLTATIRDAAGNTVTSDSATVVTFAKASGAGTVTGTGTATAANGVATKMITAQLAGSVTMEATASGLATGTLGAFTVIHGTATQLSLTGSTADLTSGAARVLTATIRDAAGNTVTSDSSTVVTFAKASGAGTVTGTGTATASSGVASKTVTGALAGPVTMEATAAGLTTGTLGAFTVVPGTAARIELTHSGSTASGTAHTLTATIQDTAGNTVTADSSTVVTFAKTGGAGTVTGLGDATATNGVATKAVTNAAAGQIDLDAQAPGLATGTTSYTIAAGSASTLTSTIAASPTSIVADGSSTSAITVRLKDAAGNDLTGSGGVVALSLTGAGSLSAVTDNGDGTYSATLTSPTAVGGATVTGTLNAAALAASASVTYTHGPATRIALAESGSTVAGNAHTLTATVQDANGNTVTSDSSTVVTFARTSGPGTVSGLGTATATSGVATRSVTNLLAGRIDLDAQASGLTAGTAGYTIVAGPVSPAASDSTVVAAPTAVYANGTATATIAVTLRDAGGNPIPGKTVTLAQGGGSSTITGGGSTDASGVVTFQAANATVETVTYTATDTTDSLALADDATVDFTFLDATPPTNTITLAAADGAYLSGATVFYNGAAGGSFTLSSAVADAGAGPHSAVYPPLFGYAGGTVSTPAGGPYLSGSIAWSAGTTGSFPYVVTARDAWSPANEQQTTLTVADDSTGPATSAQCNGAACAAGWYTTAPVSVALAGNDGAGSGVAQIRYTLDGSDPTAVSGFAYGGAFDVTGQGVTTVKARAFDRVGNAGPVVTTTIRIDTVVPQTTLDSTPAAATQDTTPTFAYSADEPATFQWRLDGGGWTTDAGPVTLGPLAESTYVFEVRAVDAAGNVDASPASFTFTVDTTAANTTITAAPPAATNATGASFSFTASDAGPGFECRLDGGAWTDCTSPATYSGLAEAAHTFEVRAEDAAGNVDPTPATHAWTVDLTAPDTSFLSTPANPSASTAPTFGLDSTESPATFRCNLDGGGWAACATPFTTPALADGSHTLQVRASDAAGNEDATAVSYTWLVDGTAPTGSITSPADGAALGGTVLLTSDSADAGGSGVATVVFQRTPAGGSTWTNQAASWDTTVVADGDYDLRVRTTDNAGNVFTSPVLTVTVDNGEPSLSVVAPNPVNLATADPATITATASDPGTGIANVRFDQCAEDSPACVSDSWVLLALDTGAPYTASWPIPSDGPRLLRVRATDNAGKQTTELVLVAVDRTRPTGALTAPGAGANLRGASVALTATASDTAPGTVNAVTFQVSPAGAGTWTDVVVDSVAPYAGTLDTTALADGLYDLRVFTTDAAGNADATPATVQVRVDNTNPTGSVTSPADGANLRGTIALTSDSADAGSGVATVVFQRSPAGAGTWTSQAASFDTTAVADGLYDLRVVTTDNAGNALTSAAVTVRVDNTNPTGSVTSPADGANLRGTVALASDSADAGSGVATVEFQRSPAGAGTWTSQAASFDTTGVADGLYDLRVVTTDNAGNTFTSAALTVRVDNTLPTGSVTAPANGAEIGVAPVTLTSDSADAGSGVASVVFQRSPAGAGTWTNTPATWDTASGPDAVADGLYDLRVRTTDNAGNVSTSAAITVLVDHTAPTTTASLAPGTPSNAPVTVSFSAGDGTGSGVSVTSYRVDGGSLQTGAAVVIPAPGDHSNDGAHVVEFFSVDEVGNVEALRSVTVVIDTTAPGGTGGDPGDYLRGIANLTYSTSDADVSSVQFQFSPAGAGAWSNVGGSDIAPPYEASWNTTLVADGQYDLRAVVTDSTGNVANILLPGLPKTVDNTAPSGSVTAPVAAAVVSGTVAVDASATDGAVPPASGVSAVRFEVKPAGAGAFSVVGTQTAPVVGSTYRQPLDTTSLADGPTELRVVVTDVAGNETTSATRTVTVDNDAPVVTLDDPGAAVGVSVDLAASASADTESVAFRYRPVGSGGAGTLIGTDTTAPFGVTWSTPPAAETQWELIAVATDVGGNTGTSAPRTVLVDRTQPTGSVTAPAVSATVGGPAVALAAAADDAGGSGVTRVEWEVKPFGSSTFAPVASDTSAPYTATWDSTTVADGAAEIRALVTDAAGNVRTTAVVPVTVDSTGPTVTLADPGAVVGGTVALSAATGGGAARVVFSVSPADAGTWTQIAEDASAPFGADFDTTALADGLYDLRAIGYDGLGNPSAPSVREDVRLDNTAPALVSSTPADGSVSTSASQIELTVSEPVTVVGATFDGGAAPAPTVSGTTITYSTGALADGLHVLFGWLADAGGTRTPFRVAVTIESTPQPDRPPVERTMSPSAPTSAVAPGAVATVTVAPPAWPTRPTADDFLVVSVDPSPSAPALGPGLTLVGDVFDVTARWALAGTSVTEFSAPIEILIPDPGGAVVIPATSADGTNWRALAPLEGPSLPPGARDGYYVDADGVHVLTRHLTLFALGADTAGPTPPHSVAGEMRADGLTVRWIPGRDSSGRLGSVVLYVNGEPYRTFGPTEYEAKLGPMLENDTRSFHLVQYDAAGNPSLKSETLRALPKFLGLGLDAARAALTSRGIGVGSVTYRVAPGVVPGTVIGPENLIFAVEGGSVDLVVAGAAAPEARLAFEVANAKRIPVRPKRTTIAVSLRLTRSSTVTGTLFSPERVQLYTWRLKVQAGRTVAKLRLPAQVRKPGTYRIVWVATAGSQTVRRSVPFTLVGKRFEQVRPPKRPIEVVLAGANELRTGVTGEARVVASATPDRTFLLVASRGRDVSAVVVDVDRYGLRFVRDLHAVFPELGIVALARRERTREASLKAGAARALPRRTSAAALTRVLVRVTSR